MSRQGNHRTVEVEERAFVFGGSYSNLQATEAILEHAGNLGFSADEIFFTGDIVAYCGQPAETVQLIRSTGIHSIMGNCEESIAYGLDMCGCGFEENSACDLLSRQWFAHCQNSIDEDARLWMGMLPTTLDLKIRQFTLRCIHGSPDQINRFLFPSDLSNSRYIPPTENGLDGYLSGHSGIPFITQSNNLLWVNSGSAGMPANDGTARVWYSTIEVSDTELTARIDPLDYDHSAAREEMVKAGLDNGYAECLETGIWPSHDVLPEEEKRKTGQKLFRKILTIQKEPEAMPKQEIA